jgi:dihydrolipoamide dehydrogenase
MSAGAQDAFDCIVVGSGPGGYVGAIRAAQLGMTVAIVEREDTVGGRCLNVACIPAKAVLRSADVLSEVRAAATFGITVGGDVAVDFAAIASRRRDVIATLTGGVRGLLSKNGVELIGGDAALDRDARVVVGGRELVASKAVVLATGSVKQPIPGVRFGGRVIGTEDAWALSELPGSLAVVGAGASGVEIASAYARLGSSVQLFEVLERPLPSEDPDISKVVLRGLTDQGVEVHTSTPVADVESHGARVTFSHGDERGEADWLVIAAGRAPDVDGLGLDRAGIALDAHGRIAVDERLRTSRAGVYAIGDLVAGPALAHKASDEGVVAVEDAAGRETRPIVHVDIPRATFCSPNVGSFGLTEPQAREQDHDVVVGRVTYAAVGAGTVLGDRAGLVKIVGDGRSGEILGGHVVGARATELIQELASVKHSEGGFVDVARAIHGHPTLSEAVMEAARAADGWLIHG